MPCCCPPRTTTEPISTLILRFLTAESEPVISWAQAPPSRETRDSCATLGETKLSGAATASATASPTICDALLNVNTPFLPGPTRLINLWQLRKHGAGLRLDVLALILRGQRHQDSSDAAVGLHRLDQAQRFDAHAGIVIVHQSAQHGIADVRIALDVIPECCERLQPHARIGVVLQRVNQRFADLQVTGSLREQINRIDAHAR